MNVYCWLEANSCILNLQIYVQICLCQGALGRTVVFQFSLSECFLIFALVLNVVLYVSFSCKVTYE